MTPDPGTALARGAWRARARAHARGVLGRMGVAPRLPAIGPRTDGVVQSLQAWAAETPGAAYEPVWPAERIVRRPPKTLTPHGLARLERLQHQESPEAFRALVPGARLVQPRAPLALTADRRLLLESAFEHVRADPPSRRRLHRAKRLEGRHMMLLNQWWENHFHWFADTLTRAALLPIEQDHETRVLVPAGLTRLQMDSLEMIGLRSDRLVFVDHQHVQVDELVFPSFAGRPGYPPRRAAAWLRDRLAPGRATGRRRLWVSRAAATRGQVANEAAVVRMLARHGFEAVQPETQPLVSQMELFASAEVVVAPHGAGLANLVAARDATVIELQSERWWGNGCYYALADALDLDYWYLMCESTPRGHLAVDLPTLEATLEAATTKKG